jgi:hypothetical protein
MPKTNLLRAAWVIASAVIGTPMSTDPNPTLHSTLFKIGMPPSIVLSRYSNPL